MGFEQKHDMLSCLFSENHCGCGFVNTLIQGKIRLDQMEAELMVARTAIQREMAVA